MVHKLLGLDILLEKLSKLILENYNYLEKVFPYKEAGKIQTIREKGTLLSEEYTEDGMN